MSGEEDVRVAEFGDVPRNRDREPVRHDVGRNGEQHRGDTERLADESELPGGGTEPGTTTHNESCQVPVPLCTPGMAPSEICVTG